MASVALRGFEQFEAALARAWDDGRPDAFAALERLGKAYLEFARAQPAYLLGDVRGRRSASAPIRRCARPASAPSPCCAAPPRRSARAMPAAGRPPALMVALHIWAMAHGVASLFGRGDGAQRALPMSPEELLEAQVLVYLRGLGVEARRGG